MQKGLSPFEKGGLRRISKRMAWVGIDILEKGLGDVGILYPLSTAPSLSVSRFSICACTLLTSSSVSVWAGDW